MVAILCCLIIIPILMTASSEHLKKVQRRQITAMRAKKMKLRCIRGGKCE